jgi:hypothetical protein
MVQIRKTDRMYWKMPHVPPRPGGVDIDQCHLRKEICTVKGEEKRAKKVNGRKKKGVRRKIDGNKVK